MNMDNLSRIIIFSLAVLFGSSQAVELTIQPDGELRQGDTVTLTCTKEKEDFGLFDVLKIRRLGKGVNSEPKDILSNNDLKESFANTGRYEKGSETNLEEGRIVVQINGITGQDRGTFECYDRKLEEGAQERLTVLVSPKSVQVMYKNEEGGDYMEAADGSTISFTKGKPAALKCVVMIEGSVVDPTTMAKIGEDDVVANDRFTVSSVILPDGKNEVVADANNLYETMNTVTIEEMLASPNTNDDGKTFMCSASMPGYDEPTAVSVTMEVKFQPEMMCESARTKLGTEYQLTCKASMNPKFTEAVWSWGDDMLTEIDAHTVDGNKHFMYSLSEDSHTFMLHIKKVAEEDFQTYKLKLINDVGEVEESIILEKEEISTPKPTPKPTKPSTGTPKKVTVDDNGGSSYVGPSSLSVLGSLLTIYLILKSL